ncbi:MAG TPA: PIN domain-containing protein [Candidimonas sp.]|nr:PIN domain-containing protein [Candidimonas sp.]
MAHRQRVGEESRQALLAGNLHREYKLATADAIVDATARRTGAELLACDAHFKRLSGVTFFAKTDRR